MQSDFSSCFGKRLNAKQDMKSSSINETELHGDKPIVIRPINAHEIMLLTDFLYEAIFQPDNAPQVPRTAIQDPMIWSYVNEFGTQPDDFCLVALADGVIVGAIWSRHGCSYGKINDITPELAMSVYPEYRHRGIGKRLLSYFLDYLSQKGYMQVSLSVDKANFAVNLYRQSGFEIHTEREHDYLMVKRLNI